MKKENFDKICKYLENMIDQYKAEESFCVNDLDSIRKFIRYISNHNEKVNYKVKSYLNSHNNQVKKTVKL